MTSVPADTQSPTVVGGRRAFALFGSEVGLVCGLDGRPRMESIHLGGNPLSLVGAHPGELRCAGADYNVSVWVPTRTPALLLSVTAKEAGTAVLAWSEPGRTPTSVNLDLSEGRGAHVALSPKQVSVWQHDADNTTWPRGLGGPDEVPARVGRERQTARRGRLSLELDGDPATVIRNGALQVALGNVEAWVTKGPDGEPMAVSAYGPEGARSADPEERDVLARALVAVGAWEDVERWAALKLLDEHALRVRGRWLGGDDGPENEVLWKVAAAASPARHVAEALVILETLHRGLGLRPDAAVARVGLAPRCGSALTGFTCSRLRVGSSEATVTYRADALTHRFEARQTWGVAPLMLVLEPWIAGEIGSPIQVDGREGAPTCEQEGAGVRIRLQMPLEEERTLELARARPAAEAP